MIFISMGDLAGYSGKDVVKKFVKIGYRVIRQRGSHVRLCHSDSANYKPLTVPMHKEVKIGLLKQLIKDVHLSVDDFVEL